MPDALRRAVRTFVQTLVGTLITSGVLSAAQETGVVDWSALKKVGVSALAAAIVAVLTWAQNALEDTTTVPALLKAPPSPGVNPVPDEGGHLEHGLVLVTAAVLLAVIALAWALGADLPLDLHL